MDAMGMDVVIIETVGVGQDEVDIVRLAHTTVVVMVPGMGDDIQAIKAGILEIGDLFVVNKADRDGADRTARDLASMLEFTAYGEGSWRPPVLKTEAQRGTGVEELVDLVLAHHEWLRAVGRDGPPPAGQARDTVPDAPQRATLCRGLGAVPEERRL